MLEAIRRAISFLRQKQVLHKLGVLISIAVIAVACYVLYHMLRGIDTDEVIDAIKSTEPRQIALAALFVAAGYFTLTFYDWFSVRAVDQVAAVSTRGAAFAIIIAVVGCVAWVWTQPRGVGRGPWTVTLPGGPLTLLQTAIGIVDLGFCALAMYVLVPDEPNLGFVVVAVIFVSATLLGFASHSPGGLGVFDAAMLVGLWQMDREELLGGMLLFRVLYYISPFIISVILLTFREVIVGARMKRLRQLTPGADAEPRREAVYVRERGGTGA